MSHLLDWDRGDRRSFDRQQEPAALSIELVQSNEHPSDGISPAMSLLGGRQARSPKRAASVVGQGAQYLPCSSIVFPSVQLVGTGSWRMLPSMFSCQTSCGIFPAASSARSCADLEGERSTRRLATLWRPKRERSRYENCADHSKIIEMNESTKSK